ncbi:MAG TPA: glutamate synthase central domain-containing protein, partial [Burkholderiaceae bacterium]|nr:glutamate synthase central domain-containing protein [Burkholderiaceae bacterium]
KLPPPAHYGAGLVFLPRDLAQAKRCQEIFEQIVKEEGQTVLGWRDVPTDDSSLGPTARAAAPSFKQIFIARAAGVADDWAFERKLYVIRKRTEHTIAKCDLSERKFFYVPSLSARTLVYKGMLTPSQVELMFPDLSDATLASALALVHSRFSTNTFPSWPLAHPFRYLAHNGEINTLRGNINWMRAREALCKSELFGDDLKKIFPTVVEGGSDSATFDNVLELLHMGGRELPHAVLMMIPEAWSGHEMMDEERKAFYEFHGCIMEPWDGPASIAFTDGTVIGAVLDRNGLRPSRYYVTKDGLVIMASEVGVLDIPPENILIKERLHPGRIFLVDTRAGRIIDDAELKKRYTSAQPYRKWLDENIVPLSNLPLPTDVPVPDHTTVFSRQQAFGYTHEDLRILLTPMGQKGEEPIGSMGNDAALAVLSDRPRLLYDYFKQLFAQVTNPPLDAIREELVTQVETPLGPESNLFAAGPESCRMLKLKTPVLDNEELAKIRQLNRNGFRAITLPMLFPAGSDGAALAQALDELRRKASEAIAQGYTFIILSDRGVDAQQMPVPALLAIATVHHHLVREGTRTRVGLIVESGEPR